MGLPGDEAGPDATHLARRVEHGIVLPLQMRGTFDGHGPAGEAVGLLNLLRSETKMPQQLEPGLPVGLARDAELLFQHLLTQDRGHKGGMNGKGALQGLVDAFEHGFAEPLGLQFFPGYPRSGLQGSPAQAVGGDFLDLFLIVAQLFQGRRDRGVDDLEVAAAGELFELHQGEIRLHPCGVAVHDQPDGSGRRDRGDLSVAVAVALPLLQSLVPDTPGRLEQLGVTGFRVQCFGEYGQAFVLPLIRAVDGPAMIADHPQHVFPVGLKAGEGSELFGQLGGGQVGLPAEQGSQTGGQAASLFAVVGDAHHHEQTAQVGKTQSQGAILIALSGDLRSGKLSHQHADLQHDRPDVNRVEQSIDIEAARFGVVEDHQVEGGQVTGRVVEKHVLRAGIGGPDFPIRGAGVPFVDGRVILYPRIGAVPGCVGDLIPNFTGLEFDLQGGIHPPGQDPGSVLDHSLHKLRAQPDGVVGRLTADRVVGFLIPLGGVLLDIQAPHPL